MLVRWLATGVGARTAAPSRPGMLPQPQLVWAQDLGRPPLPDPASFRSRRVDAPGGPFCTRRAAAFVLGALCLTPGTGLAAPGDPLGPDDTGCAPASREELRCESTLADALSTLVAQMTRCKLQQADNAFRILYPRSGSTPPPRFDEERCAQSQAKAPFDLALSQLEGAGLCPPAALVNAHELGNTLIAGPLTPGSPGVLSGAVYCDATSGTPIDPAASASPGDGGFVPSTAHHLRCSDSVEKSLALLARGMTLCHLKLARAVFDNRPLAHEPVARGVGYEPQLAAFVKSIRVFSEEACERRAQARYERNARRLTARGMCPPCLDLTRQLALRDATVATAEQESGRLFVCPGSTTSTTTTSTTTTSATRPPTTNTQPAPTTTTRPSTTSTTPTSTTRPPTTSTEPATTTTQPPTTSTTVSTTTRPPTTSTRPPHTTTTRTTTSSTTTSTALIPCTGPFPACLGDCPAGLKCKSDHLLGACVCE